MSNTRKTNPELATLLAAARLPERTVDLCLRGDLQAEWEDLQRQLEQAKRLESGARSLGDPPAGAEIEEQIAELEATMADSVLTVRFRAMNRKAFQDLGLAHPPRKDDKRDTMYGFNVETFNAALIRACCVDPDFDDEQWARLFEVITPGQYTLVADTVTVLNHSAVDVPFSSSASARAPDSAKS